MINFFVHLKMSVGFNVKPKLNWINRFKKGNNRLVQSLYSRLSADKQNPKPDMLRFFTNRKSAII